MEDGYTKEEWKIMVETKKILDPKIKLTATAVRVPVFIGHAEAVNIEFENPISADEARDILREAPGCLVIDKRERGGYITPHEAAGEDATYISRIRDDPTVDNGLVLWCVADNLRKGAALNAIQIAEAMITASSSSRSRRQPDVNAAATTARGNSHLGSSLIDFSRQKQGSVDARGPTLPAIVPERSMVARIARSLGASLGSAKSASAATASAAAFLVFAAALSFLPEAPQRQSTAWKLRGSLAGDDAPRAITADPAHRRPSRQSNLRGGPPCRDCNG